MTGFIASSSNCGRCPGLGITSYHSATEPAITGDMTTMRGLGDLTTLATDFASGDIGAVVNDLLPYLAGAGALYLVYRYVIKGGSGGGSSRRRRLSQARELAAYEIAKARVGA